MEKEMILGLQYASLTMAQAVEEIAALTARPGGKSVVTAGTEHVMMARKKPALYDVFNDADMILVDGIGVVKASRIVGKPLPERVGGTDTTEKLLPVWAAQQRKLFLLGAAPGVAEKAAEVLRDRYSLDVCGAHDGYFADDAEVLGLINEAKPDVLFVCLGAPKQEKWMQTNKHNVGDCLMLGLGGSLDVWAGNVKRAPKWMIKLNLEWLGRLLRQPSRLGRMMKLPGIYRLAWKEKRNSGR
ncbi:MAG: WecB/TagA/CpsF family glycosyltransferase [Oscillospiraceae bacterium]|nr:WecB/TagA/CpsF family glycosyltransferase [Oscillospiraceae bacterium]